jgi:hypothetical protein
MNIVEIIPQDNYMLYVKSDDGKTGLFDVKPYLDSEVFSPLKDKTEFERLHNGKYFIEWDCGADLSADTIQARWETESIVDAQQSASADSANAPPLS